jgi:hypothetical protein
MHRVHFSIWRNFLKNTTEWLGAAMTLAACIQVVLFSTLKTAIDYPEDLVASFSVSK